MDIIEVPDLAEGERERERGDKRSTGPMHTRLPRRPMIGARRARRREGRAHRAGLRLRPAQLEGRWLFVVSCDVSRPEERTCIHFVAPSFHEPLDKVARGVN